MMGSRPPVTPHLLCLLNCSNVFVDILISFSKAHINSSKKDMDVAVEFLEDQSLLALQGKIDTSAH